MKSKHNYHKVPANQMLREGEIYPPGLILETLQTFALLLPQWDPDTMKWFQKQQGVSALDLAATEIGHLFFAERNNTTFEYWLTIGNSSSRFQ
jgi:hypothetical protein